MRVFGRGVSNPTLAWFERDDKNDQTGLKQDTKPVDKSVMNAAKKQVKLTESIHIDNLISEVLQAVASGAFERAIERLHQFLNQASPYPKFRFRMERMVNHAVDLVNAIRAKRTFPGMRRLTRSKQQDLSNKSKEHFDELQLTLFKMKRIMIQLRNSDLKSTLWVVRSLTYSVSMIFFVALLQEFTGGFTKVVYTSFVDGVEKIASWMTSFI
jgi:hypothetical protein